MKEVLRVIVDLVATVHNYLLHLNDSFELYLSDKELHFLVMGLLGLGLFAAARFLFSKLRPNAIAWLFTFAAMGAIILAIEIGQYFTNTGDLEFSDIAMGAWGVLAFSAAYALVHYIFKAVRRRGAKAGRRRDIPRSQGPDGNSPPR